MKSKSEMKRIATTSPHVMADRYFIAVEALRKIKEGTCCNICRCHSCEAHKALVELGELPE